MKGIVVEKRKTKKGELLRLRTRSYVFIPEGKENPSIVPSREAAIDGKRKGRIYIAHRASVSRADINGAFEKAISFVKKNGFIPEEEPTSILKDVISTLFLLGRKSLLLKFLKWPFLRRVEYLNNPLLFYTRGHLDFPSARLISDITAQPLFLHQKIPAFGLFVLEEAYRDGRESLPYDEFIEKIAEEAKEDPERVKEAFLKVEKRGLKFIIDYDRVYLSQIYHLRRSCLEMLKKNPDVQPPFETDDPVASILLKKKYSILTGGPGTGKTTFLKDLASLSEDVYLTATTGKAAKKLGEKAVTIHALLGYGPKGFSVKELKCSLLVVDEASMLNWYTLYAVLRAAPRVLFSGDPEQLPPVEGESVFREMLKVVPSVKLVKGYRFQGGRLNVEEIPVKDEIHAILILKKLIQRLKNEDFQVITPIHHGPLGTKRLNLILRNILNPDGSTEGFRQGDRVIVTRNIYVTGELLASNGQTGIVEGRENGYIRVKTGNDTVLIEEGNLELSYALTVHRFQGSEADYVIFILPFDVDRDFITDELLFVGKTRAKIKTYFIRPREVIL